MSSSREKEKSWKDNEWVRNGLFVGSVIGFGVLNAYATKRKGQSALNLMKVDFHASFRPRALALRQSTASKYKVLPFTQAAIQPIQKAASLFESKEHTSIIDKLEKDFSKNPIIRMVLENMEKSIASEKLGILIPTTLAHAEAVSDAVPGNGELHGMMIPDEKASYIYLPTRSGLSAATLIHEATHFYAILSNPVEQEVMAQLSSVVSEELAALKELKQEADPVIQKILEVLDISSSVYADPFVIAHEYLARLVQLSSHTEIGPENVLSYFPKSSKFLMEKIFNKGYQSKLAEDASNDKEMSSVVLASKK